LIPGEDGPVLGALFAIDSQLEAAGDSEAVMLPFGAAPGDALALGEDLADDGFLLRFRREADAL
jgi:hypothetical protein